MREEEEGGGVQAGSVTLHKFVISDRWFLMAVFTHWF